MYKRQDFNDGQWRTDFLAGRLTPSKDTAPKRPAGASPGTAATGDVDCVPVDRQTLMAEAAQRDAVFYALNRVYTNYNLELSSDRTQALSLHDTLVLRSNLGPRNRYDLIENLVWLHLSDKGGRYDQILFDRLPPFTSLMNLHIESPLKESTTSVGFKRYLQQAKSNILNIRDGCDELAVRVLERDETTIAGKPVSTSKDSLPLFTMAPNRKTNIHLWIEEAGQGEHVVRASRFRRTYNIPTMVRLKDMMVALYRIGQIFKINCEARDGKWVDPDPAPVAATIRNTIYTCRLLMEMLAPELDSELRSSKLRACLLYTSPSPRD